MRIRFAWFWALVCCISFAKAQESPAWKPGEVVSVAMPELGNDFNEQPSCFKVRLPLNYDPAKPMPLLLWLVGGSGTNDPEEGVKVAGSDDFAVAAFPYPSGIHPYQAIKEGGAKMDIIWVYHKAMIEKLFTIFPNIDPKVRIAGGMSNGAHAIGSYVARGKKEFIRNFHAFILIEGGGRERESVQKLPDNFGYLAWGQKGYGRRYMSAMVEAFEDAGITTTTRVMPGVGHAFPESEIPLISEWIDTVARPGLTQKTIFRP